MTSFIHVPRKLEVHHSYRARVYNHSQVADSFDRNGWTTSKLWNVGNYYSRRRWGNWETPDYEELKHELKSHNKYKGLHSQSS